MTQEITVVPVDARTADWPRKVATVLNRLQNTTALAGGSAAWGGITGTLSAQTDLQTALNAKQATLVSGTNIKTVNSTTLLGSGNLAVGTVTSVGLTVPTGLSIAGSPVTSSGTLAVTFTSGYSIPTDAAQTNWNTAFGWGNHASAGYQPGDAQLTSLAGLSFTGNALKVVRVNAGETDFELATASGSGTVTTTGSPASGNLAKFSGATSITNGDLSGDVTTSGTLAATIPNNTVTYAKMQDVSATDKVLGRSTAGSGDVEEIACTASGRAMIAASSATAQLLLMFSGAMVRKASDLTAQNLSAALTVVTFDTETYDVGGWHDNVTNNSRLTVPSGVSYVQVGATMVFGNVATGTEAEMVIEKNGATNYAGVPWISMEFASTTHPPRINISSGPIPVTAGDYFELFVRLTTDTSVDILTPYTTLWIRAVG